MGNDEEFDSNLKGGEKKTPQSINTDSHNAKMARMEAVASSGYGGGIPAKIDEGEEPMEDN